MALTTARRHWRGLIVLCLCAPVACKPPPPSNRITESQALEDKLIAQQQAIAQRDRQIAEQSNLIQELRKLKGDRSIEKLYHVEKIEVERLSGPYDDDRDGKSDGIVTYLSLFDQDGDVCKSAGSASVRLLDLSSRPPTTIAEANWTAEQLRPLWYGRFMTQHYTLRIPWPPSLKDHPPAKLTILAQFTDSLTGKTFEAQREVDTGGSPEALEVPAPQKRT